MHIDIGDIVRTESFYREETGLFHVFEITESDNGSLVYRCRRLVTRSGKVLNNSKVIMVINNIRIKVVEVFKTPDSLRQYYDEKITKLTTDRDKLLELYSHTEID